MKAHGSLGNKLKTQSIFEAPRPKKIKEEVTRMRASYKDEDSMVLMFAMDL